MKLIRLSAENFGVLHNEVVDCHAGLNVFCRENGAGKTTLAAFLCAMLYGLLSSRKADLEENERKKYQPWQGGPFGGSMTFSVGDKTYRAERYFAQGNTQKRDTFVLYDLSDNSVSDDYSEDLGFELFGLDAAAFARSAYLPQRLMTDDRGNESISARLSAAMEGSSDADDGDLYRSAVTVLDKQRQYYQKQGGRGYLAELDERLAALHEKEYAAKTAKADAEAYSEEARQLQTALDGLQTEKQRLWDAQNGAQTRRALLAHGRSLIEHRDAQLASAAETRRFLHLDDDDGIADGRYGEGAIAAAEKAVREAALLRDKLSLTEEAVTRAGEEQNRIERRFAGGIPDAEQLSALSHTVRLLEEIPTEPSGGEKELHACFSEEELARHTGQALMHAQMAEVLAQPQIAKEAYCAAMEAAGMDVGDVLPDEDTMQAYADMLGEIASNRERQAQILPKKEEADASLAALLAQYAQIPPQNEIVVMRSRFDALRGRTEEIEELEARQRLAVQVDESIRRRRRIRIALGCGLLLIAAVLALLYVAASDVRLLFAGVPAAAAGLLLLLLGIGTRSDDSDETRALEDAALKRLCVKKSEYETEKTQIYEFLDRIGADAPAVLDANDAAVRFDAAASAAREREVLSSRADTLGQQYEQLAEEEARLCAGLTSYTKSGGGELADVGDDRAVFSDYRKKIAVCREAKYRYDEEERTRAQARARQDALALVLQRYFAEAEAHCPADVQKCGDTDNGTYAERMTAWCRTADLLRIRMSEAQTAGKHRQELLDTLDGMLRTMLSADTELSQDGEAALTLAKDIVAACARYQTLADEKENAVEQRAALQLQITDCDTQVRQILDGYFDDPSVDVEDGLRLIRAKEAALAEDMNRLRAAQKQVSVFLSEHGMTEEMLADNASGAEHDDKRQAELAALEEQIREKTDLCAKARQNAERASRLGAEGGTLRAQILHTEEQRTEVMRALRIIRTAQTCLEQAKTAMSTRYLSYMQARFRLYWGRMMHLTEEATAAMSLDASFAVQNEVLGARRESGYFSRGLQDCMNFCVRLAMIDAMYTDGGRKNGAVLPPLILDDPFVNLDKQHLETARALLDEIAERFQILYFVCHESRM